VALPFARQEGFDFLDVEILRRQACQRQSVFGNPEVRGLFKIMGIRADDQRNALIGGVAEHADFRGLRRVGVGVQLKGHAPRLHPPE
jgi:hypothetical protein